MSRADLVDVYISGLQLTAVSVVCSGKQCRICTDEPGPGEKVKASYHLRPTHADLVLMTIGKEGLSGTKPAALAAAIEQAATLVGAPVLTASELRKVAEAQVVEIVERIKASNQSGALKHWNTRFKQYRRQMMERAQPALPYHAFIERFVTAPTVRNIAASGRAI